MIDIIESIPEEYGLDHFKGIIHNTWLSVEDFVRIEHEKLSEYSDYENIGLTLGELPDLIETKAYWRKELNKLVKGDILLKEKRGRINYYLLNPDCIKKHPLMKTYSYFEELIQITINHFEVLTPETQKRAFELANLLLIDKKGSI